VKAEDIEVEPDSNLEPTHHLEQDITAAHSTDESEIEFVERPDTQAVMADEQEDVDAVAASEFSEPEVTDSLTEDTDDTDPAAVASVPSTETTYASADDIEVALDIDEDDGDFDPEIVEIFIEEATELLEDIERALHDWQDDWNNTECAEDLKRSLHTFRGGARLAGLMDIGDVAHDFESVLIEMDSDVEINQHFFRRLNDFQDNLHKLVDQA